MKRHSFHQRLSFAVAPALALLLGGSANQAQAAFNPVGDWDFYLTGDLKGVAQITFVDGGSGSGGTLDGIHIHSPGHVPNAAEDNGRGYIDNPEDPRGTGGDTNAPALEYGGAVISGSWGYDLKGKIVGAMILASSTRTNGLSFKGSGATGKRMTFRGTRDGSGSVSVYHGVPRVMMGDISGDFFMSGKKTLTLGTTSSAFTEILNLTAGGSVNQYDVVRHGPGYDSSGLNFAILTTNKRLGIYGEHFTPGTSNVIITALSGSFKTNKLSGKLGGFDGTSFISVKIGKSMAPP